MVGTRGPAPQLGQSSRRREKLVSRNFRRRRRLVIPDLPPAPFTMRALPLSSVGDHRRPAWAPHAFLRFLSSPAAGAQSNLFLAPGLVPFTWLDALTQPLRQELHLLDRRKLSRVDGSCTSYLDGRQRTDQVTFTQGLTPPNSAISPGAAPPSLTASNKHKACRACSCIQDGNQPFGNQQTPASATLGPSHSVTPQP